MWFAKWQLQTVLREKNGGDTMHALLKLPMSYIGERKSLLTGETLQQFRKRFNEVNTLFVDECSMVARAQWYQADLRLKQAKREFVRKFGGTSIVITGDLLQLPSVKKASVCDHLLKSRKRHRKTKRKVRRNKKRKKREKQKNSEVMLCGSLSAR